MADYEERYEGNGEEVDNYGGGGGGSTPHPRSNSHGVPDDYNESKSQVDVQLPRDLLVRTPFVCVCARSREPLVLYDFVTTISLFSP